ncbi:MAG: hypothetical protein ACKVE4_10420 [Dissulfuribacterales bacterium]
MLIKISHSMRVLQRNKNIPCPICGQIMNQQWIQPPSLDDSKKCWSGFYNCKSCAISWHVRGGGGVKRQSIPLCPACGEALMEDFESDNDNEKSWYCSACSTFLLNDEATAKTIPEIVTEKTKTAI